MFSKFFLKKTTAGVELPINAPDKSVVFELDIPSPSFTIETKTITFFIKCKNNNNMSGEIHFNDIVTLTSDLTQVLADLGITDATTVTDIRLSFNSGSTDDSSVLTKSVAGLTLAFDTVTNVLSIPFVVGDWGSLVENRTYNLSLKLFFGSSQKTTSPYQLKILPQTVG